MKYLHKEVWFCNKEVFIDNMMGSMNIRRSLLYLHAECEALIWTMKYMKIMYITPDVIFSPDYSHYVLYQPNARHSLLS